MSSGITPITLAYLIEISIVANLAYREIKFSQNKENLDRTLKEKRESVLKHLLKMEIEDKWINYPEIGRVRNILEGKYDLYWGRHKVLRWIFKDHLFDGLTHRLSSFFIIFSVTSLVVATFTADISFNTIMGCVWSNFGLNFGECKPVIVGFSAELIWFFTYIILTASVILPLWFMYLGNVCCKFLFVDVFDDNLEPENNEKGVIGCLVGRINKQHKIWLTEKGKAAADFRVNNDPSTPSEDESLED